MTFDEFWKHYVGGDKDKSLETGRIYAESAWDYQQARIEALTTEVEEQARLLGASGSREAELLARVEALEKAARALHNRIISLSRDYDADDCHIINEAIVIDIMLLGGEESDLAALLQEPTK